MFYPTCNKTVRCKQHFLALVALLMEELWICGATKTAVSFDFLSTVPAGLPLYDSCVVNCFYRFTIKRQWFV